MFVGKGKGENRICMENYFQNIFPKISGSQEDNLTHFLVVKDTRKREFCYPVNIRTCVVNIREMRHEYKGGGIVLAK